MPKEVREIPRCWKNHFQTRWESIPGAGNYTNLFNGTLLVREVEVERKAGLDGAKEGLDLRGWGRG